MTLNYDNRNIDANRDSLTGASGVQPVGSCIGAIVGGLVGGVAEAVDPIRERANWSENFSGRDSAENSSSFEHCGPAFGFGVNARERYPGRDFDDVESEMASDWAASRGASILSWKWAKHAARDAWNRISPSSGLCA
jgi:hypothetical protein